MRGIAAFLMLFFACVLCAGVRNDTVSIVYDSPDYDIFLRDMARLQDIDQKKVVLSGKGISGKKLLFRRHDIVAGVDSVSEIPYSIRLNGDSVAIYFNVRRVNADSVLVLLDGPFLTYFGLKMNAAGHILLETNLDKPSVVGDTIPLIAYSAGVVSEFMYNGNVAQSMDYCELRNANLHPLEWMRKYGIDDFFYYDVIFIPRKER